MDKIELLRFCAHKLTDETADFRCIWYLFYKRGDAFRRHFYTEIIILARFSTDKKPSRKASSVTINYDIKKVKITTSQVGKTKTYAHPDAFPPLK